VVPVFASESLRSLAALSAALSQPHTGVLSLDRRDGRRLDPAGCWDHPELWPGRVIVMTLERVGADAGPDLDTLREVRERAPAAQLVGAGGIRNADDLTRAQDAGAHAWLVASALHDGRLPPAAHADP
jgi:phosphoribosylformimino-5-aminoimidazole carboxamide ribotide isomerase